MNQVTKIVVSETRERLLLRPTFDAFVDLEIAGARFELLSLLLGPLLTVSRQNSAHAVLEIMLPIEPAAMQQQITMIIQLMRLLSRDNAAARALVNKRLQFFERMPDRSDDFDESAHRLEG